MAKSSMFSSSLLGPVGEPSVTIAIDTSASMYPALGFIRRGLEEWLKACSGAPFSSSRLNLIAFDTTARLWQSKAVELTFERLKSALAWVARLRCAATSNLADGLSAATADTGSQAVYLITDGSPGDLGSRELLTRSRLNTWNYSLQPVHVVLISDQFEDTTAGVRSFASTWEANGAGSLRGQPEQSNQRVLEFFTELARRSFGSVRCVRLPDPRQRASVHPAQVLVDF